MNVAHGRDVEEVELSPLVMCAYSQLSPTKKRKVLTAEGAGVLPACVVVVLIA